MTTTNNTLTECQVENLWRAARNDKFLAELCENWLDEIDREGNGRTIVSYLKGSKLGARIGVV